MPAITANSKLALNFQSKVDGAKEIRDYGSTGHIITQNNTCSLSTTQAKFGSSSVYCDGNSDYISVPDHGDWTLGTGDWCVELWIYPTANQSFPVWYQYDGPGNANYWYLYYNGSNSWTIQCNNAGATQNIRVDFSITFPTLNNWHHLAFTREGTGTNCVRIWIDGVPYTGSLIAGNWNGEFLNIAMVPEIMGGPVTTVYYAGYFQEYRFSKGICRYSTDFSGSLQTKPWGNDSYTKLLIHGNSYDCCPTPKIPTFLGTAQIDTAVKKFGESSLYFDGNSDYITIPDSADWSFGSDPFTIEFFVYQDNLQSCAFFGQVLAGATSPGMYLTYNNTSHKLSWFVDNSGPYGIYFDCDWTPSADTWYHIALVHVNTDNAATAWRIYIDGTSQTLTLEDGAWNFGMLDIGGPLSIGARLSNSGGTAESFVNGMIDGFHVVKGTALYTAASITVPTAPPYSKYYSRKAGALPANKNDLTTIYTTEEEYDTYIVDTDRINQLASATNYAIHQFKDVTPNKNVFTITWTGQSDVATSSSTATLQAWNITSGTWTDVDTDTATAANTNFTLTGTVSGAADYITADGEITCRVHQQAV